MADSHTPERPTPSACEECGASGIHLMPHGLRLHRGRFYCSNCRNPFLSSFDTLSESLTQGFTLQSLAQGSTLLGPSVSDIADTILGGMRHDQWDQMARIVHEMTGGNPGNRSRRREHAARPAPPAQSVPQPSPEQAVPGHLDDHKTSGALPPTPLRRRSKAAFQTREQFIEALRGAMRVVYQEWGQPINKTTVAEAFVKFAKKKGGNPSYRTVALGE
jgi:hypothetical protein